jgi:anthranilate synthase component I
MQLVPLPATLPPFETYRRLERRFGNTFLLESMEGPRRLARVSIMGFNPRGLVAVKNGHIQVVGNLPVPQGDDTPRSYLRAVLAETRERHGKATPEDHKIPMNGGLVGFFSYDYVRYVENLPDTQDDDEGWPDLAFGLYLDGLVMDHAQGRMHYFTHADDRSEAVLSAITHAQSPRDRPLEVRELVPNMEQEEFETGVRSLKRHIREGDIFQAVLSKRLSAEYRGDATAFYAMLRQTNPSPYMYQLNLGERHVIGASPEMLVRVTATPDGNAAGGIVETFPIAGTRPHPQDAARADALGRELMADPKERAEHNMLVDLARNDAGRIAKAGSVRVAEYMNLVRYSHVQHLVSRVTARLGPGKDALDAFDAMFPAGTVSGAPKVRAMELLDRHEPTRRGPYAGAVGYISLNGNLDTAITIRTLTATHRRVSIQSGAGIVADSDPTKEWHETEHKARALVAALQQQVTP